MITEHIELILLITGGVTSLVTLQFLAPDFFATKIVGIQLKDDVTRFYFGHWGLVVFSISMMLVWAAFVPEMQKPVVTATLIEKAVLTLWIFKDRKKAYTQKMFPAAIVDAVCSVLYILFLLGY